ncbi:hypothetical protein POM88_036782 [Heracleum sosnowskyi]|uniref:Uncharacterized protein n=1 Tax=Heracleum sosnowskyi TaxID=360622 RepID=A0AAD8HRC6_9APIA|nr:hypothetical protein POM88_036782 [Heracleum sosnowskyi]
MILKKEGAGEEVKNGIVHENERELRMVQGNEYIYHIQRKLVLKFPLSSKSLVKSHENEGADVVKYTDLGFFRKCQPDRECNETDDISSGGTVNSRVYGQELMIQEEQLSSADSVLPVTTTPSTRQLKPTQTLPQFFQTLAQLNPQIHSTKEIKGFGGPHVDFVSSSEDNKC